MFARPRASERFHQFTDYQDVVYGLNFATDEVPHIRILFILCVHFSALAIDERLCCLLICMQQEAHSFGDTVEKIIKELMDANGGADGAAGGDGEEEERARQVLTMASPLAHILLLILMDMRRTGGRAAAARGGEAAQAGRRGAPPQRGCRQEETRRRGGRAAQEGRRGRGRRAAPCGR